MRDLSHLPEVDPKVKTWTKESFFKAGRQAGMYDEEIERYWQQKLKEWEEAKRDRESDLQR